MRGIRAIVVTATCVSAGALALSGSTLADPAPAPPALVRPAQVHGAPVLDGAGRGGLRPGPVPQVGPVVGPVVGPEVTVGAQVGPGLGPVPEAGAGPVPRTSYATRHVPTREEAALTGALHPATDRVMAYLIGWVLLAVVGGGLLAGQDRGVRLGQRLEP